MKCVDCENKCDEYNRSVICDKAYYEWCCKEQKCESEEEENGNQ